MTQPSTAPPRGRARLYRLKVTQGGRAGESGRRQTDGDPIELQFNPATLRLQRQGTLDAGGLTAGTNARQHTGVGKATLTFDLEFDTTEDGDGSTAVDVRTLTQQVRQFVEPPSGTSGAISPPAGLFEFGTFRFCGIVTSVNEEIDYFLPPDSTPARAKVSVSMQGLDDRVESGQSGPGARTANGATDPGTTSSAPGGGATNNPERTETALNGESAAALAARLGGNPAAWRSLDIGSQASPLSIPPGTQVGVGPEISMPTTAVGRATGFARSPTPGPDQLAAALGMPPITVSGGAPASGMPGGTSVPGGPISGGIAGGPDATREAGFALTSSGGIAGAAARVAAAQTAQSAQAPRAAFAVPSASAPVSSATSGVQANTAGQLRSLTAVDARSLTYGRSVPLRAAVVPMTRLEAAAADVPSVASLARPLKDAGSDPYGTPSWARRVDHRQDGGS